jgi:hypothetical protein
VTWWSNVPARSRYDGYVSWLFEQLNRVMPPGQVNTFLDEVHRIAYPGEEMK